MIGPASFAAWILLGGSLLCALAETPTVEHIFPAGFSRNSTNDATLAGKFDPWPPAIWTSCPGVSMTTETNKGKLRVQIAADAPLGPHLMRAFNTNGASALKIFVITPGEDVLEAEPNDSFRAPQFISALPRTVNGRLNKPGDVDCFAFHLAAGEWLEARLDAYTLASKMDALLRLLTPDGLQQTWNHDFMSLDPRISWQAPSNGTFIVQVMGFKYPADSEVRLTGGDGCVYRLHLDALAHPPDLFPSAAPEHEPNNTQTNATLLALPSIVHGAIDCEGDQDWFGFHVEKDETIEVVIQAACLGSKLNAALQLVDQTGKQLAQNDDLGPFHDPRIVWKAPDTGIFYAVIRSFLHAGGAEYGYRLLLNRAIPEYRASIGTDLITLTGGETNAVKLTLNRLHGFDRKLTAKLVGLPVGVTSVPVEAPAKTGEMTLTVIASADAKPAQVPVRIVITDSVSSEQRPVLFNLTASTEDNGVPGGYTKLLVESTDELWLSLKAKPVK